MKSNELSISVKINILQDITYPSSEPTVDYAFVPLSITRGGSCGLIRNA